MSDDHDMEPIPGLPEELPEGERILWQGAPDWRALAVHAFRLKLVALYFAALALWTVVSGFADGLDAAAVARNVATLGVPALLGGALLVLMAWLTARTTVYTLTDRRIVMRYGMALPMVVNVPFSIVTGADARFHADGTVDIPLALKDGSRLGFVVLWPHARPWRLRRPEPMLRNLPDGRQVARRIADALAARAGRPAVPLRAVPTTGGKPGKPGHDRPVPQAVGGLAKAAH